VRCSCERYTQQLQTRIKWRDDAPVTRGLAAHGQRHANPRCCAGLVDAPGAGPICAAPGAQQRRHALGQRPQRWFDPPELAPPALCFAGHRLRGGPRAQPPAGDEPQPSVLGHGAQRGAGLPGTAYAA